jgi:hypothetical protein
MSFVFLWRGGAEVSSHLLYFKLYYELYFTRFIQQKDGDKADHDRLNTSNDVVGVETCSIKSIH